jgi:hypothetical protein
MKSGRTYLKNPLGASLPLPVRQAGPWRLKYNREDRQEPQRKSALKPPKSVLAVVSGLLGLFVLSIISCADINSPGPERDFNLSLRYGILARNELNTFENTITKDLILDGTVTIPLSLAQAELDSIEGRMEQIGFFSYPDTFIVRPRDSIRTIIMPNNTYEFKVTSRSMLKELYWDDAIIADDPQATRLRELIALIREIVESKPEYQRLPPARGVYI